MVQNNNDHFLSSNAGVNIKVMGRVQDWTLLNIQCDKVQYMYQSDHVSRHSKSLPSVHHTLSDLDLVLINPVVHAAAAVPLNVDHSNNSYSSSTSSAGLDKPNVQF